MSDDWYDDAPKAKPLKPPRYIYPGVPSTVEELADVLIAQEAQRPRTTQVALGPSELGTPCDQQIARKLVAGGVVPAAHEPAWAPFQGSAVHVAMDDVVDFWNVQLGRKRFLTVKDLGRLDIGPGVTGELDVYDVDNAMIIDWKHVGESALKELRAARKKDLPLPLHVSQEYRVQAHLYGLGMRRRGYEVKRVRLVLLARSWKYEDSEEWTEPYNEALALAALARYDRVKAQVDSLDIVAHPERIVQVKATVSGKCFWCPFRRYGKPASAAGCPGK
ncbi:MAG: hypothetical protein ABW022_17735 [Actinoplanes sp.]